MAWLPATTPAVPPAHDQCPRAAVPGPVGCRRREPDERRHPEGHDPRKAEAESAQTTLQDALEHDDRGGGVTLVEYGQAVHGNARVG